MPCLVVDVDDEDTTIPVPDHLNDSELSLLSDKNFDHSIQSEPSFLPSSDSEVGEDKPEAVFEVREHEVKSGSQKGKIQKIVVLSIGSHNFKRRRKMRNGSHIFTCNGCEKIGHYLSAVVGVEDEESDQYFIIRAPSNEDHQCWAMATANQQTIKKARDQMCDMVLEEPTRSLLEIYEEVIFRPS